MSIIDGKEEKTILLEGLKTEIKDLTTATQHSSNIMIWLTVSIAILTFFILILTGLLVYKEFFAV